jgi:hypothetical protein
VHEVIEEVPRDIFKKRQSEMPPNNVSTTRNSQQNQSCNDLYVKPVKLIVANQDPSIMVPRLFNALPLCIKEIEDDKLFIKVVKAVVLQHQYYSFDV